MSTLEGADTPEEWHVMPYTAHCQAWLDHWREFQQREWVPSTELRAVVERRAANGALWLSTLIEAMAFGGAVRQVDIVEEVSRKISAFRAVALASRSGDLQLYGSNDPLSDESKDIPKSHFDFDLVLGHADNSIVHDPEAGSMEDFVAITEGKRRSWFQVRVTWDSFEAWVRTLEAGESLEQQRDRSSTPTRRGRPAKKTQGVEVRSLVYERVAFLMDENGDFDEVDPQWNAKFHS